MTIKYSSAIKQTVLFLLGLFILLVALYQNFVLKLPYFYALFSVGMSMSLAAVYNLLFSPPIFHGWRPLHIAVFALLLLASCVAVDQIGMALGYWEYPHYGPEDTLRKYIFEWGVALFYHLLSLLIGLRLFERMGVRGTSALLLGTLIIVTPVGFLTEYLNLHVYSWRVLSMPLSNMRIGEFFLVFQTIGYWAMALIPYLLYRLIDRRASAHRQEYRQAVAEEGWEN